MAETQADWQELFDVYRSEVIRAGFASWDEAAYANDTADDEAGLRWADRTEFIGREGDVSARFERYARAFVKMVGCLERETVQRLVADLGERVRTRDGLPVTTVVIRSEEGADEVLGDRYAYEGLAQTFLRLNETLFAPEDPDPIGVRVPA